MSLLIKDIPPTASEADLFELFKQHGPLKVIKIPRDQKLRTPLGHAYVTYYNPDHAEAALAETALQGHPIACSLTDDHVTTQTATPAHVTQPSPHATSPIPADRSVFVRGDGAAKSALENLGATLTPKGPNAFVAVFPTAEDASDASRALADDVAGLSLEISPVRDPKTYYTNLFVRGLAPQTSEDDLRRVFEDHGKVTSLLLPLDEANRAKGFGFVNFGEHTDAVAALESLDGSVLCGNSIQVSRAQSKLERQAELKRAYEANRIERLRNARGTNLYITNLNPGINNERLRAYFSKFGEITSVRIMLDPNGNSKGFGFVCFRDPDHASNAIAEMHNRSIEGNVLQVAIAHKKDPQSAPYSLGKRFPQHVPPQVVPQAHTPGHMMYPVPMGHLGHPMMVPMMAPGHVMHTHAPIPPSPTPKRDANGNGKFKKRQPLLQPYGNIAASVAAAATPQAAKEIVGETLYPIVQRHPAIGKNADTTAHVTGIMLQHDNQDILSWLEDEQLLNKRIQQACDAYREWLEEGAGASKA
ncbi:Polyadenylate-binding protein, cytoplasmic and nuclear [Yarrowia sp. B02]|nr:Polyadenylate-binding protein, cytoplasmic and nuclear [Yarrowia sp. B02]